MKSVKPPKWCLKIIDTFEINPKTGIVTCSVDFNQKKKAGSPLGGSDGEGYLKLVLKKEGRKNKHVRMHNVAWYLYYGEWPDHVVDHHNGITSDNKKRNLRACTDNQNCQNRKIVHNKLGHRGIREAKRYNQDGSVRVYYQARIFIENKRIDLGTYKNVEDAINARLEGEKKYFQKFSVQNR